MMWISRALGCSAASWPKKATNRSEEHTSELQSHLNLVCRLLLEKKNREPVTRTRVPCIIGLLRINSKFHYTDDGSETIPSPLIAVPCSKTLIMFFSCQPCSTGV